MQKRRGNYEEKRGNYVERKWGIMKKTMWYNLENKVEL